MHDILTTLGGTAMLMLEGVGDHLTIDQLSVHEDLVGMPDPSQQLAPLQFRYQARTPRIGCCSSWMRVK